MTEPKELVAVGRTWAAADTPNVLLEAGETCAAELNPNEKLDGDRVLLPKDSPLGTLAEATWFAVDLPAEPNPPKVEDAFCKELGGCPKSMPDEGGEPARGADCSL